MKLINQLQNISGFSVSMKFLSTSSAGNYFSVYRTNGELLDQLKGKEFTNTPIISGDFIWHKDMYGKSTVYHNENFIQVDFGLTYIDQIEEIILGNIMSEGTLMNLKFEKIWNSSDKIKFPKIYEDKVFYKPDFGTLYCRDILNGNLLWEYSFSPLHDYYRSVLKDKVFTKGDVNTVLGIHDSILWLVFNSNYIIGLDKNSGEQVYIVGDPDKYPNNWTKEDFYKIPFGFQSKLDNKAQQIIGMFNTYYGEVDISGGMPRYEIFDIEKSCQEHQIKMNRFGRWNGGDEIYFWEGSVNHRVGCFSRSQKEIIWSAEIEEAKGLRFAIKQIDYHDKKLYVLDGRETLHIYDIGR